MRIAIIGAGITGLTAAYRLSQKGHQIIVFEKEKYAGGLAAGFHQKNWGWGLENFYHHLFTSDTAAKKLIAELGLTSKLFYEEPKTALFYQGKTFQFDSPSSLLRFPYLSFAQKLRAGFITAYLKSTNNWQKLEKIIAAHWLSRFYGQKPYQILWEPLLKSKFGSSANQIPMSWFWARIKKRSSKLGYLKGGFQVLIDKLVEKIKENGGKIYLSYNLYNLYFESSRNKLAYKNYNKTIITTPAQTFFPEMKAPKMLGALNLILFLKKPFLTDGTYWLNINEPGFPFVAVVEHTNLINPSHYGNSHILYIGGYYPQNHRYFRMAKEGILKEFQPYLQKINPVFNPLYIVHCKLCINPYAQPVIPLNYSKVIPPHQTPIKNVYLANMQQIYPWDRGINYSIEMGETIANEVIRA